MVLQISGMMLAGCGIGPERTEGAQKHQVARLEGVVPVPAEATVPDCALLDLCPDAAFSPEQCVDDPSFLRIESYEGHVIDVSLDAVAVDAADAVLPAGEFFTVLPDPTGGCALTVASFTAESLVLPEEVIVADDIVVGGAP